MGRVRWKTALPVFVGGYFAGSWRPTRGPAGIQCANPLNSRVLPGPKRIRGGEARNIASDRAGFLGSHPNGYPPAIWQKPQLNKPLELDALAAAGPFVESKLIAGVRSPSLTAQFDDTSSQQCRRTRSVSSVMTSTGAYCTAASPSHRDDPRVKRDRANYHGWLPNQNAQ